MTARKLMKLPLSNRRSIMKTWATPELVRHYQEAGFVATNNQTITVEVDNDYAAEQLVAILKRLKAMGIIGQSREIDFKDGLGGILWDGDGACRIGKIETKEQP